MIFQSLSKNIKIVNNNKRNKEKNQNKKKSFD